MFILLILRAICKFSTLRTILIYLIKFLPLWIVLLLIKSLSTKLLILLLKLRILL